MSGGKAARIRALRAAARQADDVSGALSNFIRSCREVADALEEEREPAVMAELFACATGRTRELVAAIMKLKSAMGTVCAVQAEQRRFLHRN